MDKGSDLTKTDTGEGALSAEDESFFESIAEASEQIVQQSKEIIRRFAGDAAVSEAMEAVKAETEASAHERDERFENLHLLPEEAQKAILREKMCVLVNEICSVTARQRQVTEAYKRAMSVRKPLAETQEKGQEVNAPSQGTSSSAEPNTLAAELFSNIEALRKEMGESSKK